MSSENWETLYPLIPVVILKLMMVSIIYVSHILHFQASLKLTNSAQLGFFTDTKIQLLLSYTASSYNPPYIQPCFL